MYSHKEGTKIWVFFLSLSHIRILSVSLPLYRKRLSVVTQEKTHKRNEIVRNKETEYDMEFNWRGWGDHPIKPIKTIFHESNIEYLILSLKKRNKTE